MTPSITTFSMTLNKMWHSALQLCCFSECHLCWVSFLLNVTNKSLMLSVIMLNVVMLSVVVPSKRETKLFDL
jgi:hypothetical protein